MAGRPDRPQGRRPTPHWIDSRAALGRTDQPRPDVAVALGYDMASDSAPKVVAKGEGEVAARIIEIALANGVKVRRDADLAALLAALDIDAEIPYEAFAAVAEILSYVYQANRRMSEPASAAGERP